MTTLQPTLWTTIRSYGSYALAFLAGLVLWIDPRHIDNLVSSHPKWSGAILFLWTALLSWANKTRPPEPHNPHTYSGGTR